MVNFLSQEKKRRNKLARTKLFVKIYLNNKLVYVTNESQLQNDFTVKWAQIFNIYMISHPESIHLQIFEYIDSKSKERLIGEINIPSPDRACTSLNYNLEDYEFSSKDAFYMHLKTTNQSELFYTSGKLKIGACWAIDEKTGNVLAPSELISKSDTAIKQEEMKNFDAIAALGVSHMQDIEKLAKWILKSNLDPNDPRNADLINLIRTITESDGSTSSLNGYKLPDYFRLDQQMQEFNFTTDEEIDKNLRYKIIKLRDQKEPEFRGYRNIPASQTYVKKEDIELYEKRKLKDATGENEDDNNIDKNTALDISRPDFKKTSQKKIDQMRLQGKIKITKLRERILKQFRFAQNQKSLSDMIIEEQVPNINALGNLFWNLYVEPRRPLYPNRRERKKVKGPNVSPDDVHIIINVVNAYDLPVRKEKLANDPMKVIKDPITGKTIRVHETIAGESLVKPFVEITFQETVYRTSTADGPNASWNQEIDFLFKAPNNDLRPESLQTCKDNIYFNIFDEIELDILEDERQRDHTVHKRKERYWLGSLKIPFSTVYFKSKIEGTFKIETPPVMLGYTRDPKLSHIQTFANVESNINMDTPLKESSYLSLYITIEPQLLVPDAYRENYDSIESFELLDKVVNWSTQLKNKNPTREFRPIVMNTDGKSVLITRYIRAIKPPEILIQNGEASFETALNVSKFVSLIPFVSDSLIFPGICDIWSTCDQFMETLCGDEEEHSVLLVNFFLGLGKKAWLLIGSSITNGLSSYALSIENGEYTIWYQGQPYKVNEPHNPIKVVSAIVNQDEMWFNIQPFDEPYRIKFDVTNSKHWKPFFGKTKPEKFESIQKENLKYEDTKDDDVKNLANKIDSELRARFKKWREEKGLKTKFQPYTESNLKGLLEKLEKNHHLKLDKQFESDELKKIQKTYRISGFPINLPYTDMSSIIEAVYSTQVHAMPSNNVEFALSVYVHPYPNSIVSVWIYIAILIEKN